ncbi:MAG: GntR family transcriptional regulator [Candidatus Izimaplasma sp.]|nr:GntR family transcriptional regulator [Candidatus Izimaplasma bacterium]
MPSNCLELITIDRRSRVPFDSQIKERIKGFILDQTLYYKTALPMPNELAKALNITEKKVVKAYQQLIEERFIKQELSGIYKVSYFELTNYFFDRNTAVYDAISTLGLTPSIRCVEKKVITLTKQEIEAIGFDASQSNKYFYINRLYLGDKQPIMLLENYLPLYIFKNIDQSFVGDEPLDAYIKAHYNLKAQISKRQIKAVNLDRTMAKLLNERPNAASIQSTNKVYDHLSRLIDYGRSHTISSYYFQTLVKKDDMVNAYPQFFNQSN